MIHDFDSTLKKLLLDQGKLTRSKIDISFEQPTGEWSSRLTAPTINLWCFAVHENVKLRNLDMQVSDNGRRAVLRLPPLRFDLTYLVTAWANEVEDEHQLIWRTLAVLARHKTIAPEICEGALRDQPYEVPITMAQAGEAGANMSDIWSVLDNQMRLGFTLTATLALDIEQFIETPLVLEKRIGVGQSYVPPDKKIDVLDQQIIQKGGETEARARRRNE